MPAVVRGGDDLGLAVEVLDAHGKLVLPGLCACLTNKSFGLQSLQRSGKAPRSPQVRKTRRLFKFHYK